MMQFKQISNSSAVLFAQLYVISVKKLSSENLVFCLNGLRRRERVFRCCCVCETMEDYKEGYLMVWTNYISPYSSIVGLYFKGTCDVISVTMATHKVHKGVL